MFLESKHTFSHIADGLKIKVVTKEVSLTDIVNTFQNYLKACGFIFEGNLELVQENELVIPISEYQELQKLDDESMDQNSTLRNTIL